MIKIVVGEKGKGKTKVLIENANTIAKTCTGFIIYLDKNKKHMYELGSNVRYLDMSEYCEFSQKTLKGFVSGLVAGNHDINVIFIDSFLTLADHEYNADLLTAFDDLQNFSENYGVDIILSISASIDKIPEKYKNNILASL